MEENQDFVSPYLERPARDELTARLERVAQQARFEAISRRILVDNLREALASVDFA